MAEDASVFSVQWADLPITMADALSAEKLLTRYLGYIKKCTLSLIRPVTLDNSIEFRLIGTGRSLISFLPPMYTDGFAILRISGGFLVQPRRCDRGEFSFGVERHPGSVRVSLQLSNFCPLILGSNPPSPFRVWLYRVTQAAIHRLVTIRFLALLYHDLGGPSTEVRVINVVIRDGKPV
jgi:hypothetical protein